MHQMLLQISTDFITDLYKLGPVVGIMGFGLRVLYKRQVKYEQDQAARATETEARAKELSDRLENYMKEDRALLLTALQNNTTVMQRIEQHLNK